MAAVTCFEVWVETAAVRQTTTLRESCLTGCNDRDPVALPRASLSFLVKQPGGLGCILHSKCSKLVMS